MIHARFIRGAALALLLAISLSAVGSGSIAWSVTTEERAATENLTEGESLAIGRDAALEQVAARFDKRNWIVVAGYLILTTILGAVLAGRQATIRDFFLGGRKLPWPAVCGSIIATEISAATFLTVPALVFAEGGNFTYLQLAIGTILARFIIGYYFVPAFYEREIYSPYDYMGHQLGFRVRKITTALFVIGAVLAQGVRVYIAGVAVQIVTGLDLVKSITLMGAASVLWGFIGGIRTVIWTDVIQFILFTVGAIVAFVFVSVAIDGGAVQLINESYANGKMRLIDASLDPKKSLTLWCGLFGTVWLTLASHGTDQLNAQRMFTCRDQHAARKAIIWSSASQLITIMLLLVGAGLWVYYRHNPMDPVAAGLVKEQNDRVFALFIVTVLPVGVSGLVISAIFAAAISTFESALTALSESTLSTVYKPLFGQIENHRREVFLSRLFIILWGVVLVLFAIYCDTLKDHYPHLIEFALAMAAYTYGALLGTFLLALLPTHRNDLGLLWGVPLSMLTVFALAWHSTSARIVVALAAVILVGSAMWRLRGAPHKIAVIGLFIAIPLAIEWVAVKGGWPNLRIVGPFESAKDLYFFTLAWPWHFPIGTLITFTIGFIVGERRRAKEST